MMRCGNIKFTPFNKDSSVEFKGVGVSLTRYRGFSNSDISALYKSESVKEREKSLAGNVPTAFRTSLGTTSV